MLGSVLGLHAGSSIVVPDEAWCLLRAGDQCLLPPLTWHLLPGVQGLSYHWAATCPSMGRLPILALSTQCLVGPTGDCSSAHPAHCGPLVHTSRLPHTGHQELRQEPGGLAHQCHEWLPSAGHPDQGMDLGPLTPLCSEPLSLSVAENGPPEMSWGGKGP